MIIFKNHGGTLNTQKNIKEKIQYSPNNGKLLQIYIRILTLYGFQGMEKMIFDY